MLELSVAIPGALNVELRQHLIRDDGQEDLCFALWHPSSGERRYTALINAVILPENGDRQVHGNVSFNQKYLERACQAACAAGMGIAFLHSHPGPGWQGMSPDDIAAEQQMMDAIEVLTGFPLVGLTCGSDGYWSGRFWGDSFDSKRISWCASVRVIGEMLTVYFNDRLVPPPLYQEMFKRTETVWGPKHHANLARLRVGIIGLGSVGSLVAETLARMGMTCFYLVDFDEVQPHNLDRLLGATKADIGKLKIDVAARQMIGSATAKKISIQRFPFSVAETAGYRAALDCDVILSCVDRPRARAILNHLAYAHLIPVIDGGIQVRFKAGAFSGADWQLQTVGPGRPCLECLGTFKASDVETEKAGMLEDSKYMDNLPADHRFKNNENVFPFSANLASLEVFQLIALVTGAARITDFGVQRFRYMPGHLESDTGRKCESSCFCRHLTARGDKDFCLAGTDVSAAKARERQAKQIFANSKITTAFFHYDGRVTFAVDRSNRLAAKRAFLDPTCRGVIRYRKESESGLYVNFMLFFTADVVDAAARRFARFEPRAPVHPLTVLRAFEKLLNDLDVDYVQGLTWLRPPQIHGWTFREDYMGGLFILFGLLSWLISLIFWPLSFFLPATGFSPFHRYRVIRGKRGAQSVSPG